MYIICIIICHNNITYYVYLQVIDKPCAQCARKLSVAVVHTTRVFEVLVAVVGIGKHLSAPLALVAFI